MKKCFYIRDFIQNSNGMPLYYMGYTTNGSWTTVVFSAKEYSTKQEALWKIEELIKEEKSEYELVTIYR